MPRLGPLGPRREGGERVARYSFLGAGARRVFRVRRGVASVQEAEGEERALPGAPLDALRSIWRGRRPVPLPGLPRFTGGLVGFFSYDLVRSIERLPEDNKDDLGIPDTVLADYETLLATHNRPNPGHYVSVATMLAKLEDQGIGPAIEMLDKGITRLGLIPQLQQYAIELELRRKNIAQAIIRLGTLEAMLGASPEWRLEMGAALLLAGRPSEARRHLDEAASQFARIRMTPARQHTLEKLRRLRENLEGPGS